MGNCVLMYDEMRGLAVSRMQGMGMSGPAGMDVAVGGFDRSGSRSRRDYLTWLALGPEHEVRAWADRVYPPPPPAPPPQAAEPAADIDADDGGREEGDDVLIASDMAHGVTITYRHDAHDCRGDGRLCVGWGSSHTHAFDVSDEGGRGLRLRPRWHHPAQDLVRALSEVLRFEAAIQGAIRRHYRA